MRREKGGGGRERERDSRTRASGVTSRNLRRANVKEAEVEKEYLDKGSQTTTTTRRKQKKEGG